MLWLDEDPNLDFEINTVLESIDEQPTIDAEPVRHGTWETSFEYDCDGNKLYIHFHRECGFEYRNYLEDEQQYCPHCGAKMDGGEACGTAQTQPNGKGCEMRITAAEAGKDEQTRI
jgi:hypothetical protein